MRSPPPSEARALRDRLEALQAELQRWQDQVLKVKGERERYREKVEAELEQLRGRARKAEAAAAELTAELRRRDTGRRELPVLTASPWRLVALAKPPSDPEEAVLLLSSAGAMPAIDARLRLRAPTPLPLALLPEASAHALCAALEDVGLAPVWCDARIQPDPARLHVRAFRMGRTCLELNPREPGAASVPYSQLRLLVLGTRVDRQPADLRLNPPEGGHGPARLVRQRAAESIRSFLWLYADSGLKAEPSSGARFDGLGPRMRREEAANLRELALALRERAPHAVVDERLVRMAQWRMALLKEGDSYEAMGELLWQAVQAGHWSAAL